MAKKKGKGDDTKDMQTPDDMKRREYYSTKIWQAFKLFVRDERDGDDYYIMQE